jgi:hypothetical protein
MKNWKHPPQRVLSISEASARLLRTIADALRLGRHCGKQMRMGPPADKTADQKWRTKMDLSSEIDDRAPTADL